MIGLYSNYVYSTDATSQRVGGLKLGGKGTNWDDYIYIRYENDGAPFNEGDLKGVLNDNNDRYRTNGFEIGYGDLNLRLLMFTGSAATSTTSGEGSEYPYGYYKGGDVDKYRLGALSLGYGQYRIGLNSEYIRNVFQNQFAHKVCKPQAWFKKLSTSWDPYFYYGTTNRYSLWF